MVVAELGATEQMAPFLLGDAAARSSMHGHEQEQMEEPTMHIEDPATTANMRAELMLYRERDEAAALASSQKLPQTRPDPFMTPASASPVLVRSSGISRGGPASGGRGGVRLVPLMVVIGRSVVRTGR